MQGNTVSHPFGDLVSQHLHRKHGLSQAKLAAGILQAPTIVSAMCKGRRLVGPQARERVVAIIGWLHEQGALDTLDEANALLDAAGMSSLNGNNPNESALINVLRPSLSSELGRKSTTTKPAHTHNLPAPTTALIGREKDVAAASKLLGQGDVRAVTLIGPPGVGKSRLALQVALESRNDFADGAWFVALAPVSDPNLVAAAIVQALDLPSAGAPPLAVLKDHLRDKQALLVLDNFEQVLAATPLVAEILATAPGVKVLVTSRAALHISGEHTLAVPPLDEQSAVELFVRRAQAIKPDFTLGGANRQAIADICKRLDALPLAIELAAARIRLFEPQILLARLSSRLNLLTTGASDVPPHQRTLRGAIDWSYNLLTPEEQTLFRRLGVFAGGCTLEPVEEVAGEGLGTPVVDLMQSLADKSLVRVETQDGQPRFTLLEMLREYAVERLEESGESAALRRQHAEYFVSYAERVQPAFSFLERADWTEQLDRERDNIAAALTEARNVDDVALIVRLIGAAAVWLIRLPDAEGWAWLPELFGRSEARMNPLIYAKALYGSAFWFGMETSAIDAEQQLLLLQKAAHTFESLGETVWQAGSLAGLGNATWRQGKFALTERYCTQSARLFEEAGQKGFVAGALVWLAGAQRDQGRFAEAERLFQQCIAMVSELQNEVGSGSAVNGLGELEFDRGNYEAANGYYDEAYVAFRGTTWRELAHFGKGRVAYAQGRTLEAVKLLEACVVDARYWANTEMLCLTLDHLAFVRHLLDDEVQALALLHKALTLQHKRTAHRVMPESLERAAWIAADQNRHQHAARLLGAAMALRESMGMPFPLGDMPLHEPRLQAVKAALDEATFAALWEEGRAMSLDQAVTYALSEGD
jgi:predicted ATPase